MNRISVIIPTFNHAKTILNTIESLLGQTRKPDEIIVIDDGSTDETKDILKSYLNRIDYFFQENQGAPKARNEGFKKSTGDFLLFCDADILLKSNTLELSENFLNHHTNHSFVYGDMIWNGKKMLSQPFSKKELFNHNFIHTTALLRRGAFLGFDETLKRFQDWDLWISLAKQNRKGIYLSSVLFEVLVDKKRKNISNWLPSFFYKIPWPIFGFTPKAIEKYENAKKIILKKHFDL